MTTHPTTTLTELARRSSAGIDVTLYWAQDGRMDGALVCVCDRRDGAYFEIQAEACNALDVYYHPFAYRTYSAIDYEDSRLAA